jgi:hypothetical protein
LRRERPEDRLNWVLLRLRLVVRAFCAFPIGRFRYVRLQPSKRQIAAGEVGDKLTTRDFGMGTRGFAASEDANLAVCVMPGRVVLGLPR